MNIYDRLKLFRENQRLTQNKIADELKITQSSYNLYESGKRNIPDEIKIKIKEIYNISFDWLLTGSGSMYDDDKKNLVPINTTDKIIMNNDHVQIPILDIKASAGYGREGVDNPNIIDYLDMAKHILGRYKPEKVVCVEVTGDSMEPNFRSGDYVLCAIGSIENDGFYIINLNNNILFKRLQFIKQNKIIIKATNPLYDPEEITEDDNDYFAIIGKVFKHIRTL